MIRLFTTDSLALGADVPLTEAQTHYLLHVMRQKAGAELTLFNGQDGAWTATLTTLTKKNGMARVHTQTQAQPSARPCILCPALIKKEPMDWLLQKATELGATEIRPMLTQRTVVNRLNRGRAQAIVIEAAEQCERLIVPHVFDPQPLAEVLRNLPRDVQVIYLHERSTAPLPKIPATASVAFLIGPEGGFTPDEFELMARHPNAAALHLPGTILRAETAALAALSCWQFRVFEAGHPPQSAR